eukprot:TRINITY_DN8708_c6_g1_i1.p1 TRINITY_DN8708_c6_g1~~TRINITY_DN8708_c6_g1_i1.p1  ORF type:complete len:446 (+),score=97.32 TRINITY_DN8708_c6_g1_i1:65-1402(+)
MALRAAKWLSGPVRNCWQFRGFSAAAEKETNDRGIVKLGMDLTPRRSDLFEKLFMKGMGVGSVSNGESVMERAAYFMRDGCHDDSSAIAATVEKEYYNCRNNAAIWDMSSFVKFSITGPDALAELERLASLKIDRPVEEGKLVYCCLCNEKGGIEADVTILRTGEESFYMVVGAELLSHVESYFEDHLTPGADIDIQNISDNFGVVCCAGPTSRKVLEAASPTTNWDNESFPFGHAKEITINGVNALALRVNFMGDLGWELHTEMSNLPLVYDAVSEAGAPYDVTDAGYMCLASLRTEKMFLHWGKSMRVGVEVTGDISPLELGFPVKKTDFIARKAIDALKGKVQKRLVSIVPKDDTDIRLSGHEKLMRDGVEVGIVSTTAYSYLLGKPIGIGWVERTDGEPATWKWVNDEAAEYSIELKDGSFLPCTVQKKSALDPEGERMRA